MAVKSVHVAHQAIANRQIDLGILRVNWERLPLRVVPDQLARFGEWDPTDPATPELLK